VTWCKGHPPDALSVCCSQQPIYFLPWSPYCTRPLHSFLAQDLSFVHSRHCKVHPMAARVFMLTILLSLHSIAQESGAECKLLQSVAAKPVLGQDNTRNELLHGQCHGDRESMRDRLQTREGAFQSGPPLTANTSRPGKLASQQRGTEANTTPLKSGQVSTLPRDSSSLLASHRWTWMLQASQSPPLSRPYPRPISTLSRKQWR
jgi:hypothetical protein